MPTIMKTPRFSPAWYEKTEVYNRLVEQISRIGPDELVPNIILSQLLDITLRYQSVSSAKLLVETIFTYRINLGLNATLGVLKKLSRFNKDAAYECGLAYLSTGRYPLLAVNYPEGDKPEDNLKSKAWYYFMLAAALGHPQAFPTLLDAICDKKIKMDAETFTQLCREIVQCTIDLGIKFQVAFVLGTYLCGKFIIDGWEGLLDLALNDPTMGFTYLAVVAKEGGEKGYSEMSEEAFRLLKNGLLTNIFKDEFGQKKRKEFLDRFIPPAKRAEYLKSVMNKSLPITSGLNRDYFINPGSITARPKT